MSQPLRLRRLAPNVARHAILLVAVAIFFGPFVWMLLTSFKSSSEALSFPPTFLPHEWRFDSYLRIFTVAPFGLYYLNSTIVTVLATFGQIVTSLAAGYAFARMRFRGRTVIFVVLLAALMVPFEVVFTPLVTLLSQLGWLNSYQGLIIPNVPSILGAFLFRQFFLSFPTEIEDASRIDGAGIWRRLWSVMAPMARPMIGSFAILSFVYNWNNFFFQFLVTTRSRYYTVQVGLAQLQGENNTTDFGLLMAGSTLAIIPVMIVFLIFQRQLVSAMSGGLR
ncbi:carbohydrate ABC transporter permease [Actinocatenispora comari]|jgi:multiple sugar transport system permease protein/sn-glycerol 3-phosphate transport system permease protein|uniref:Sugar ABC transporter permease n=1 Tax=Actinocatenispora comari TaxID=2807577 RepID=A0A8J4A6N0_9ACTN|nr:carbohydrate ABC transporter permease [Actinocatenispora comari]GIL25846.1 sugar ABC transporter permease [Actinocatenispora comari]